MVILSSARCEWLEKKKSELVMNSLAEILVKWEAFGSNIVAIQELAGSRFLL